MNDDVKYHERVANKETGRMRVGLLCRLRLLAGPKGAIGGRRVPLPPRCQHVVPVLVAGTVAFRSLGRLAAEILRRPGVPRVDPRQQHRPAAATTARSI